MRVVMIGSGYVGLVSGACFSELGHRVTCVDMDEAKIAALRKGEIPLFEPGLEVMVESNIAAGNQSLQSDPNQLQYGVSVTDACIDWDTTAGLLREIAATVAPCLEGRNRVAQSA